MKTIITLIILLLSFSSYSQWQQQNTPNNTDWYYAIDALNQNTVYSAGARVLKTINGGAQWTTLTIAGYNQIVFDLDFVNETTGWGCGFNGKTFRTTNGGTNWTTTAAGSETLFGIKFLNSSTGFTCGNLGRLYKTENGGTAWTAKNPGTVMTLNKIDFYNTNIGWVCGGDPNGGIIIKTTDAGESWSTLATFDRQIEHIEFLNTTTGFACSDSKLYKTINGGINWVEQAIPNNGYALTFHMVSDNIGYASNFNKLFKTINGGENWYEQYTAVSNVSMLDIAFAPGSTSKGWMCGTHGAIIYTENSGGSFIGIQQISTEIPSQFELNQNYPNPFNPVTNIGFRIADFGFVSLKIYDVSGKEIAVLVNEELKAGTYNYDFNAANLPSGAYFYRLQTNGFTEVKKMMLIK